MAPSPPRRMPAPAATKTEARSDRSQDEADQRDELHVAHAHPARGHERHQGQGAAVPENPMPAVTGSIGAPASHATTM